MTSDPNIVAQQEQNRSVDPGLVVDTVSAACQASGGAPEAMAAAAEATGAIGGGIADVIGGIFGLFGS